MEATLDTTPRAAARGASAAVWTGRVVSTVVVLFMLFDAVGKLVAPPAVLEATVQLGFPAELIRPLGLILLVCTLLYAFRPTSVLGAILLTGFLGGATAIKVRQEDVWCLFSVAFGVLVWGGLFLKDPRVRALIPASAKAGTGTESAGR